MTAAERVYVLGRIREQKEETERQLGRRASELKEGRPLEDVMSEFQGNVIGGINAMRNLFEQLH